MEKIPVGKSIGGAYGFLFGRCLTILCLSWLPALIYAGVRLAFVRHAAPGMMDAMNGGHQAAQAHLLYLAFFLFALLMVAVIALPLNREALGLGGERVLARLVIGGRELRLFAAYIRFEILFIALIAAMVLGVIGVHLAMKAAEAQWPVLAQYGVPHGVHLAVVLLAVLLALFVVLRLSFLIGPIAAAEDRALLARAWSLSAGNFWRMLAIFVAIIAPLVIVLVCANYAVVGSSLHMVFADGPRPDFHLMFDTMMPHAPALVAIGVTGLVIACALFAGASAVAYRTLVPPPEPEEPAYEEPAQAHAYAEPQAHAEPVVEYAPEPAPEMQAPVPHVAEVVVMPEALAAHPAEEAPPEQSYAAEEVQPLTLQDELPAQGEEAQMPPPDAPDAHPQ